MMTDLVQLPPGEFLGRRCYDRHGAGFTITESTYAADARLPTHSHPRAHFCLVVSGRYTEIVDGATHLRQPGELIFYPPEASHSETHHRSGRHLLIEIESRLLDRARPLAALPSEPRLLEAPARWAAGRLLAEARRPDSPSRLAVEGLVLELLAESLRHPELRTSEPPAWIGEALAALRSEMPFPPSTRELSSRLDVSPERLSRDMRRWVGASYSEMVRRARLELARQALIHTDTPIARVAAEAGYCDQSHLTRALRTATGETPAALRRLHRVPGRDRESVFGPQRSKSTMTSKTEPVGRG